jgi:chorismate-pyruvate lyase
MVDVGKSSRLEAALTSMSGTVTDLLEQLVGEPIDAHVQGHAVTGAGIPNGLRVDEGHPLLIRAALLNGRASGRSYLYAESVLVLSRLPQRFRLRLESSCDPIGRILDEEGIAVSRAALPGSGRGFASVTPGTPPAVGDYLLARTYRVDVERDPVMVIAEWFLTSLERFLAPQ